MMVIIVADVALRNFALPGLPQRPGLEQRDLRADALPVTMCVAPWLLRQGQHIRVDILLQALPRQLAWYFEWIADVLGLACCCVIAWYAARAAWSSYVSGAVNIKTLVTPEWWALAPLPVVFVAAVDRNGLPHGPAGRAANAARAATR